MTAVIFDLEGTLVDFQWDLQRGERAAVDTLVEMGYPEDMFVNRNYAEIWNSAVSDAERYGHTPREVTRRLDQVYNSLDMDAMQRWTVRTGAEELVQTISETALVTNIGRRAVEEFLDTYGFVFDVIVTRNDVQYMKPDPTGIEHAASTLAGDVLFVGDSATDVKTSQRADVPVAIVQGGESARTEFRDLRPNHLLSEISEVEALL